MDKSPFVIGASFAVLGIISGAFGAHALHDFLIDQDKLDSYQTASKYLMFGSFTQFILYYVNLQMKLTSFWPMRLHAFGTLMFSGSIYALRWSSESLNVIFGPMTPIGGVLMIVAWVLLLIQVIRK